MPTESAEATRRAVKSLRKRSLQKAVRRDCPPHPVRNPSTSHNEVCNFARFLSGPLLQKQRPPGQFRVTETRGVIEFGDKRRELHAKAPLVRPSPSRRERLRPCRPPPRRRSRQRLDDQNAIALRGAIQQAREQGRPPLVAQLVDGEGRENERGRLRERH